MSPRAIRILCWTATAVALIVAAIVVAGRAARRRLIARTPPPGALVDVGGYRLHLWCTGSGEPTVLLEAGLLDFSLSWSRVQPAVSATTRTCSYDRAGSGWSDVSPAARTSEAMVGELHTLLTRAGLRPPFVLVGHSFGGMIARDFALRHPGDVAGLVLVDAAHQDQWLRIPELRAATAGLARQFRVLAWLNSAGLLALAPQKIPDRGLPAVAADQYRALLASSSYFQTVAGELGGVERSAAQLRAARATEAEVAPAVVISRGLASPIPGLAPEDQVRAEATWRALQDELAAATKSGPRVIATRSGHDVHLQQPALVAGAIREVVLRSRARRAMTK